VSFYLAKLVWTVLQPSSLIGLFLILAAFPFRGRLIGRRLLLAALILYLGAGFGPAGNWLLIPLESWVEKPSPSAIENASGIIVLGGAIETIAAPENGIQLNEAAERMTESLRLALLFPSLPVIFSGGKGELVYSERTESDWAREFFAGYGLPASRFQFEDRSRNTKENAAFTAALLKPQDTQKWLLVTSAFHMPRAKALFEAQGFKIIPWPVDYRTRGRKDIFRFFLQPSEGLRRFDLAAREWSSLAVAWLRGDIVQP